MTTQVTILEKKKKMFLFMEFVLDSVIVFADVHDLCLVSRESVAFMGRYYRRHTPMMLPFSPRKINGFVKSKSSASASAWDRFTSHLLSRRVFRMYPETGIRLCILLDFLRAKDFDIANVEHPRRDILIKCHEVVDFRYGKYCGDVFAIWTEPLEVVITSNASDAVLRAIVYKDFEYADRRLGCCRKIYPEDRYDWQREEFHVVHALRHTWVIVFLSAYEKDDIASERCNLQLRGDLASNDCDLVQAFENRFPAKDNMRQ